MHFLNEINKWIPIEISLTFVAIIGSDYGFAPARRQAIIWTSDNRFTDAYMRHAALMS